jgi:hypothetical protein
MGITQKKDVQENSAMTPSTEGENPVAIGMMLCDQVIVEKDTMKPSPIGIFTGMAVKDFKESQHFSVYAALTNGEGPTKIELVAFRMDNGDQIYQQRSSLYFPHRLGIVNVNIRVRNIKFPCAGWYDFVIRVNGEFIAQRKIRVYQSALANE